MPIQLNHTLVNVRDKQESASFVGQMLGLDPPEPYGPFLALACANDVLLYFVDAELLHPQHYAFLVSEAEFDQILTRLKDRDVTIWADPFQRQPGEVNHDDGGRGVYWEEPSGHLLEAITRPYGSGP